MRAQNEARLGRQKAKRNSCQIRDNMLNFDADKHCIAHRHRWEPPEPETRRKIFVMGQCSRIPATQNEEITSDRAKAHCKATPGCFHCPITPFIENPSLPITHLIWGERPLTQHQTVQKHTTDDSM